MRISGQYSDPKNVPRRIHICGLGAVGKFIAHSLRGIPNPPPITLIFHKRPTYYEWMASSKQLSLTTQGVAVAHDGFDAEVVVPNPRYHKQEVLPGRPHPLSAKQQIELKKRLDERMADDETFVGAPEDSKASFKKADGSAPRAAKSAGPEPPEVDPSEASTDPIDSLILCVKAPSTVSALLSLRHRLNAASTILFVHNGMGIIDEVNKYVFPDPSTRPNYLLGILSHGITTIESFSCIHAGFGTLSLGPYPTTTLTTSSNNNTATASTVSDTTVADPADPLSLPPKSRYLLRTLLRTPVLTSATFPPSSLLCLQLEKLAANSIINPLTSLLDCRNGALLYSFPLTRLTRLLLAETSLVLRSLPALRHLPTTRARFAPHRLETLVVAVARRTGRNVSSMLADVRAGRATEIEYVNGWIVRAGEAMGVSCVVNYAIKCAVTGKKNIVQWERGEELPFVGNVGRPGYGRLSGWEEGRE